ncbi:hypothetical protein TI06_22825, partial [Vibrio vulnificus]
MDETADDRVVAEPAAGFRFPAGQAVQRTLAQHPGLPQQLAVLTEDQRGQGAAAEVAGADPFAAVAAGEGDATGAVEQHVRAEAPGHAEVAAPGVADPGVLEQREEFAEQVATQADFLVV